MEKLLIASPRKGKRWIRDDLRLAERDTGLPPDDSPVDGTEIYYRKAAGTLEG